MWEGRKRFLSAELDSSQWRLWRSADEAVVVNYLQCGFPVCCGQNNNSVEVLKYNSIIEEVDFVLTRVRESRWTTGLEVQWECLKVHQHQSIPTRIHWNKRQREIERWLAMKFYQRNSPVLISEEGNGPSKKSDTPRRSSVSLFTFWSAFAIHELNCLSVLLFSSLVDFENGTLDVQGKLQTSISLTGNQLLIHFFLFFLL